MQIDLTNYQATLLLNILEREQKAFADVFEDDKHPYVKDVEKLIKAVASVANPDKKNPQNLRVLSNGKKKEEEKSPELDLGDAAKSEPEAASKPSDPEKEV